MPTLYRLYTIILADRLQKEIEEKETIPENKIDCRKGMGTMDNIYVLNYLVNRKIRKIGD